MEDYSKYTVLIVDDEVEIGDLIALWLSHQGFTVLTAQDGNSAFDIISSEKVDFVISDVKMPICDGEQLLEKIKTHYPHTPAVLLVTGYSELSEEKALEKGALALLSKPFDFEILLPLLKDYLD